MTPRQLFLPTLLALTCAAPAAAKVEVQGKQVVFSHQAQGAKSVHVAGSFNGWKLDKPMQGPDAEGRFTLRIELGQGKHLYKFVVDGKQWTHDAQNPTSEADGHGGKNSVVEAKGRPQTGGPSKKKAAFGTTKPRKKLLVFTGNVYFVPPGTQRLPDFRRLQPSGKIYTPIFDISPRKFSEGFPGLSERYEWFAIRYRGTFKVPKSGKYRFRLLSDDASRLYINGKLCLDNDGLHGPRSVQRWVRLKKGEHKLVLDYMQGPALEVALQLFVTKPLSTTEQPLRATSKPLKDEPKQKKRRSRS